MEAFVKKLIVLTLVSVALLSAQMMMMPPQVLVKTSEFPIALGYIVELPSDYDSTKTYPLVVGIHGFGDRMSSYVGTAQTLVPDGAIGLYPESAYPLPPMEEGENFGWTWWFWSDTTEPRFVSNDVTLDQTVRWIAEAIRKVEKDYPVDPSKVFLFGFSQGGFLTYKVGLTYPELFRGLLPAGGWIDADSLHPLTLPEAALKLPVRILHGAYDNVVEYTSAQAAYDTLKERELRVELMSYPVKHQLTNEEFEDARDFCYRELNPDTTALINLLWPEEALTPDDHAALLHKTLCSSAPLVDIEAGLLKLYEEDTNEVVRKEIIYLLGARRCTGAELALTLILADKTRPQPLRQSSYSALIKLATESSWKTVDATSKQLVITDVIPGGQGEAVGLQARDVVLSYNNRKITTNMELRDALNSVKPETKSVIMLIEREGKRMKIKLAPGRIGIRLAEEIR